MYDERFHVYLATSQESTERTLGNLNQRYKASQRFRVRPVDRGRVQLPELSDAIFVQLLRLLFDQLQKLTRSQSVISSTGIVGSRSATQARPPISLIPCDTAMKIGESAHCWGRCSIMP